MIERQDIIAAIEAHPSTELQSEVDYHLNSVDREDDDDGEGVYDKVSALFDVYERAEQYSNRKLVSACRDILIEVGFYRVMSPEEIANTFFSHGPVWSFKRSGVAYTTDYKVHAWQFALDGWNEPIDV